MNANTEQYLKLIYTLSESDEYVKSKDIAVLMDVKAPTVTEKLKRMAEEGLLELKSYRGVKLLPKGIAVAKDVLSTHRIWEVFLYEKLGMSIEDIHAEACELEHATSRKLKYLLYDYLGHPKNSPNGKPIELVEDSKSTLSNALPGKLYEVAEIARDDILERYLKERGIIEGASFRFVGFDAFGGAAVVIVNAEKSYIGETALDKIYVKEI